MQIVCKIFVDVQNYDSHFLISAYFTFQNFAFSMIRK
jgi:hypothetical protein